MVDILVDTHCEKHNWFYEVCDVCPRCFGENQERERIIALFETEHSEFTAQHQQDKNAYIDDCFACLAIELIKGDKS
jgi:hypothetical protein